MLLSSVWKSYEADKRIEDFSPYTLKAYGIQASLLISYLKDPNIDSFDTEGLFYNTLYIFFPKYVHRSSVILFFGFSLNFLSG